jgi:hypothetical protein
LRRASQGLDRLNGGLSERNRSAPFK